MPKLKNYQKFAERAVFYVIQSVIAQSLLRDFFVIFDFTWRTDIRSSKYSSLPEEQNLSLLMFI